MKKYLWSLLVLIIILSITCGCEKQTLHMPKYPLDAATVDAALKEAELSWTIVEEEQWSEEQIVHTLHDIDSNLVAFILSGIQDERRYLDASFMPYSDNPTITRSLKKEEWERVMVFATLLYGDFESKHQVYDSFTNDYDTENTVTIPRVKTQGEVSNWKIKINDVYCLVRIEKPNVNLPQEYLNTVRFDNTDGYENNLIN